MKEKHNSLIPALEATLAHSYVLYLKTQNYHWNVEGPHFASLHALFETQYTDLALAIDEIAESIRALGHKTIASFKDYSTLSHIKEGNIHASAEEMVQDLMLDQDTMIKTLKQALEMANNSDDDVIVDLMTTRMAIHRKNKWMLASSLPVH